MGFHEVEYKDKYGGVGNHTRWEMEGFVRVKVGEEENTHTCI